MQGVRSGVNHSMHALAAGQAPACGGKARACRCATHASVRGHGHARRACHGRTRGGGFRQRRRWPGGKGGADGGHKKTRLRGFRRFASWCPGEDSNLHGFTR